MVHPLISIWKLITLVDFCVGDVPVSHRESDGQAPEERNGSSFAHKWAPMNGKARLFYKHRIPTGFPKILLKGLFVSTRLLIGSYRTLLLRVAGDWLHINAKDARILANDRGGKELWHVFNVLILKLST